MRDGLVNHINTPHLLSGIFGQEDGYGSLAGDPSELECLGIIDDVWSVNLQLNQEVMRAFSIDS